MAELTVDLTYGQALLEAAIDVNKTEKILEEGKELSALFQREPEFFEFINTPVISAAEKKEVIDILLKDKITTEMLNFIYVLIDKRRTRHFSKIINRYQHLIEEQNGFSYGIIFSVKPLTEEQLKVFEEKTSKLLRKNVKLENKIDTKIIGGIRIYIEGKVIDATIKKRLDNLKESLK
ncbi:ATP synthase F1 subunit delta [Anaerovorax odorimutans]|uniref:ATP synthase F1 subunit delta n=1 Tax=Anaerovorax odorimutans TaxID=109327 RepID=UPI00041C64B1|nr:ATP synthase F1 subunit delta [Anaerovorax odorimutans]